MDARVVLLSLLTCVPCFGSIISGEAPVAIPTLLPSHGSYAIAASATRRYVVWFEPPYVFGMDLLPDGQPDVRTRKLLATDAPTGYYLPPAVIAVDDSFYVGWLASDKSAYRLLRVDGGVDTRLPFTTDVRLAWNGSRFLAVTEDYGSQVIAALFDRNGNTVVAPFVVRTGDWYRNVDSAGGKFFITMRPPIYSATTTVKTTGIVMDNDGKWKIVPLPDTSEFGTALASNGSEYLFVWQIDALRVLAQHFTPSGDPSGDLFAVAVRTSTGFSTPMAAANGSDYVVSWGIGNGSTLFTREYATVHGSTATGAGPLPATYLGLYSSPAGALTAWTGDGSVAMVRRLGANDVPHPLVLSGTDQGALDVAANATATAVVWNESNALRFGRFDAIGTPLDGNGIILGEVNGSARVFAGPLDFLVLRPSGYQLFAQVITNDGQLVGDPKPLAPPPLPNTYPYVTTFDASWNGSAFVVLWSTPVGIGGATVLPNGAVGDTIAPYALGPVVVSAAGPRTLAVFGNSPLKGQFLDSGLAFPMQTGGYFTPTGIASSGKDYVVVATRSKSFNPSTYDTDITLFDSNGQAIGGPFPIVFDAPNPVRIDVLFDGNDYRIAWIDSARRIITAVVTHDSFLCYCIKNETIVPVDEQPQSVSSLAIASPGGGRLIVLYQRSEVDPWMGAHSRAYLRSIDERRHHRTAPR